VTEDPIIAVRNLTYRYRPSDPRPVLDNINLAVHSGDYLLITGRSGSGKSTLCRTFNGLIPHFYGGDLEGGVFVAGQPVLHSTVAALFNQVAMAFQNPDSQLFCRTVAQEIAFGLESLGLAPQAIEARLQTALDQVGIANFQHHDPQQLSGGEKHLVLIAALLALHPEVLVLDEPFANLDPANVTRIRALLRQLHAEGCGIVLCEHRLSRAAPDATRVVVLHQGRIAADGAPGTVLAEAPAAWGLEAPLASRIGAALTLDPPPLRIEDLMGVAPQPDLLQRLDPLPEGPPRIDRHRPPAIEVEGLTCRMASRTLLQDFTFSLRPGECLAVVGANGAGKTTLLRHLIGLQRPSSGRIRIQGRNSANEPVNRLARHVGLAFQNPDNQFFRFSVEEEVRIGPQTLGVLDLAWIEALLHIFGLENLRSKAPYRLSGGERKRVAFASALAARPAVLALDEPTAGQDFAFRRSLRGFLRRLQARGQAVVIVTHDLTFAERAAHRWLLMAGGRLLADAAPERIMADADLMTRAGLEPTDRFRLEALWHRERPRG